ncbi:MAG: hypothetical protein ACYCVZ_00765, partial [Streptosporangiaceae bacterium]
DPATDGAARLAQVFEHQRAADRLLDEACAAEGAAAYIPEATATSAASTAYASAAAELRSAAGLLDRLSATRSGAGR